MKKKLVEDFTRVCLDQKQVPKYEVGGYGFFDDITGCLCYDYSGRDPETVPLSAVPGNLPVLHLAGL